MKKILAIAIIFLCTFAITIFMNSSKKAKAAYLFEDHIIAGGLYGSEGIPLKLDSEGRVYLH